RHPQRFLYVIWLYEIVRGLRGWPHRVIVNKPLVTNPGRSWLPRPRVRFHSITDAHLTDNQRVAVDSGGCCLSQGSRVQGQREAAGGNQPAECERRDQDRDERPALCRSPNPTPVHTFS